MVQTLTCICSHMSLTSFSRGQIKGLDAQQMNLQNICLTLAWGVLASLSLPKPIHSRSTALLGRDLANQRSQRRIYYDSSLRSGFDVHERALVQL